MTEPANTIIPLLTGMIIGGAIFTALKLLRDLVDCLKNIENEIKRKGNEQDETN